MDEGRKEMNKKVQRLRNKKASIEENYILALIERNTRYGEEPEEQEAPTAKRAATTPAANVKIGASTKKAKSDAVLCSGNVITGDACAVAQADRVQAADTRYAKKMHPSCKVCKKLVNAANRALKAAAAEAAAPEAESGEVDEKEEDVDVDE
ncbi:MAG: hypothetical protein DRI46_12775 [Chloroflexi bacterium]|nr:MAG: hypothetical protein DRI46_12775 [Chloroflexota bacterium]